MYCYLICTSYNTLPDDSLQLRNNWTENVQTPEHLTELLTKWKFNMDEIKYPFNNKLSEIYEGTMMIGCPLHMRILRF